MIVKIRSMDGQVMALTKAENSPTIFENVEQGHLVAFKPRKLICWMSMEEEKHVLSEEEKHDCGAPI